MKRFASLIAIPAIAVLGFVAVPAATGTSPGVPNGPLIHLTAAESPAASQPCDSGYAVWADASSGAYLLSQNVQNEDLNANSTTWSCWHFPDVNGASGEISDEAGYCAEYHDSYVVSAVCSGIPAQEWFIQSECVSGAPVAINIWALDNMPEFVFMNESDGGLGDLINLAASCYEGDSWVKRVPVG